MKKIIYSFLLAVISTISINAQVSIPNPVVKEIRDCGVMRFNGKYYIGGVNTHGDFYVSSDLVKWGKPIHVVDMDNKWFTLDRKIGNSQIHANDMVYLNGTFNLYWSVNLWHKELHAVHAVHAQSENALGPYIEPNKETWHDSRIDPKLFIDDDGQLYMYLVRFTDGNAIWVRKMKNPIEFETEPFCCFASNPDTWEAMDNRVAEGPWVIKYRDQYYMMYNANHTGSSWGNYQLGVAQAEHPMLFNNGNKYSYPVVGNNLFDLRDRYADILRYSRDTFDPTFAYTEKIPASNWEKSSFNDSSWKRGEGGFAAKLIKNSSVQPFGTEWTSNSLWLRKEFTVGNNVGNIGLVIRHNGDTKIKINGKKIYSGEGYKYEIINLDENQRKAIKEGKNLVTVETTGDNENNYFDMSLLDLKNTIADDILFTPGQPNILRGPNGFEWWLIYMANTNGPYRDQYIDRVQFFNKTMYVDGITGPNTKGYHPVPALPTFATNAETSAAGAYTQAQASATYLFETGVNTSGEAGIYAWWESDKNYAKVGLKAEGNCWYIMTCINGEIKTESYALKDDFRWGVYHNIRIERNKGNLEVRIDEIPAPGKYKFFNILPTTAGHPGTFDVKGGAKFDGTIYTIGFDNIDVTTNKNEQKVMGDVLNNYELSFQLYGLSPERTASSFPIYVDDKNYVKTTFNGVTGNLDVVTMINGEVKEQKSISLAYKRIVYPDVKYTDMVEKNYRLGNTSWVDAIYLSRNPNNINSTYNDVLSIKRENKDEYKVNMFSKMNTDYLLNGKWYKIDTSKADIDDENPSYNRNKMKLTKLEGLRFINKVGSDTRRHIYKIMIGEKLKENYNLRTIRNGDKLFLYVDGKQVAEMGITNMPASKFALSADNYNVDYKGILYYHIGKSTK